MKWWNFAFPILKADEEKPCYDHYLVLASAQVTAFLERDDVRIRSKRKLLALFALSHKKLLAFFPKVKMSNSLFLYSAMFSPS